LQNSGASSVAKQVASQSSVPSVNQNPRNRSKTPGVIAALVQACPGDLDQNGTAPCYREGRDEPGHDHVGTAASFAALWIPFLKHLIILMILLHESVQLWKI
jgi:hypothetical protein